MMSPARLPNTMARKKSPDQMTAAELEKLLLLRKRADTEERLRRLRGEGRVFDPLTDLPVLGDERADPLPAYQGRPLWRRLASNTLLMVEAAVVVALLAIIVSLWRTNQQLNDELAQVQRAQSQALALPTATLAPLIDVVVLPGGHQPPVDGRPPQQGEAGNIPAHLLPVINAYVPPPIPTPSPEQARRLQIPAINVDHPIVQGDDWEQLKQGVGQYVGSGLPGQSGNVVLSAHNDIYGEIFRYLDRLQPGDEVIISTESRSYTYRVDEWRIVEPTEVWVMAPTDHAQVTLISCYPYRVNTQRIVVFATLIDPS